MQTQSAGALVRKILYTGFLIATIIFIFYNSSKMGAASSDVSLRAMNWMNGALARMGFSVQLSHTLVRKLGHLGEYMLLGFWLMMALRVYTRRVLAFMAWPLLGGLLIAVCDEFYQTYIPGRSGEVRDVLIDFGGVLAGLLLATLLVLVFNGIQTLFRRLRRRRA